MEHLNNQVEVEIIKDIDFIVPLKQVGLITRAVLESIHLFYKPRRIIVVTSKSESLILEKLAPYWGIGPLLIFKEEMFFERNFGLSLDDILSEYDVNRPGDQREAGWWIQQLIKLGAATQIPDISEVYVVWDGDLVPIRRWKLCDRDENDQIRYFVAILQGESRSEFNSTQYSHCMRALIDMTPLEPQKGGTFVTHHMVFHTKYTKELLNTMNLLTGSDLPWPKLIMSYSRKFYRFSEYKTYATYMTNKYPSEFNYHELNLFGKDGLRFREANHILDSMLSFCDVSYGGISYHQVRQYVLANWVKMPCAGQNIPAYIQLDHVYGLEGIDLNQFAIQPPVNHQVSVYQSDCNPVLNLSVVSSLLGTTTTAETCSGSEFSLFEDVVSEEDFDISSDTDSLFSRKLNVDNESLDVNEHRNVINSKLMIPSDSFESKSKVAERSDSSKRLRLIMK